MKRRHQRMRLRGQVQSYRVEFTKFMMRVWGGNALILGACGLGFPNWSSQYVPFDLYTTSQLGFGLIAIGLATLMYVNLYMFKGRHA